MKLVVDPWKCQSHLQCMAAAPELFRYEEEYSYAVAIEGEVPSKLEDAARRAVTLCPERAITIED